MGEASLREAVAAPSEFGVLLAALQSEPGLEVLIPDDLAKAFTPVFAAWPEMP